MVDAALIQEGKVLLVTQTVTQKVRAAIERRELAGLQVAIAATEGVEGVEALVAEAAALVAVVVAADVRGAINAARGANTGLRAGKGGVGGVVGGAGSSRPAFRPEAVQGQGATREQVDLMQSIVFMPE